MDSAANVLNRVIYNLVPKLIQHFIRLQRIGEQRRASGHVFADFGLKGLLLPVRYDRGADLAWLSILAAFQNAHHHRFVFAARACDLHGPHVLVHVPRLLPDECFVRLHFAGQFIRRFHAEGHADSVIQKPCCLLCDVQGAGDLAA